MFCPIFYRINNLINRMQLSLKKKREKNFCFERIHLIRCTNPSSKQTNKPTTMLPGKSVLAAPSPILSFKNLIKLQKKVHNIKKSFLY